MNRHLLGLVCFISFAVHGSSYSNNKQNKLPDNYQGKQAKKMSDLSWEEECRLGDKYEEAMNYLICWYNFHPNYNASSSSIAQSIEKSCCRHAARVARQKGIGPKKESLHVKHCQQVIESWFRLYQGEYGSAKRER